MSEEVPQDLATYFRSADSWAADHEARSHSALRTAWIVAGVLGTVALAEAIALIILTPLKTVEPYTLLVDKQTGYVQALKPLERDIIAPDKALTRSFLAQYVIAREGFDISSLKDDYRKTALWSAGDARDRYLATMQATNPQSPLATLPRQAILQVQITGISSLSDTTSLVRFVTLRTDPGGQQQPPQPWQAVITYRFSGAAMSEADRLLNPLGFQVTRYRRDAEIPLEPAPPTSGLPAASSQQPAALPVATVASPGVTNPAVVRRVP